MKSNFSFFFPPALAFAGVIVCCAILWNQTARFKRSVEKIAEDVRVSLIDLNGKSRIVGMSFCGPRSWV